ncbi:MAG: glycerol-3-phosphate 1-O-acyltransferase PlsY [Chloroflexia bacterium]
MTLLYIAIITLLSYLIGGIPVGSIIARINKVDISSQGSGKTGSTNVLRSVGRRAAALVLFGDFLKGTAAVLVARFLAVALMPGEERLSFAGVSFLLLTLVSLISAAAAVAGHVWSIYLRVTQGKWQGGRGVATALGTALVVNPLVVVVAVLVAVPTIIISRYVSLGSILGTAAGGLSIVLMVLLGQMDPLSILFIFLAVFIIAAHRDNIERLLKGTERKIDDRLKV